MILKQLRLSKHLSQEHLADMSGLNVRTIQRIESGQNASLESLKCLACALEVDVSTLNQEKFMIDKTSNNWQKLPLWLKCWFFINFLNFRPTRNPAKRMEIISHVSGFILCACGFVNEAALAGGLIMLLYAHALTTLLWQGDLYGAWYDKNSSLPAE